MDLSEDEVVDEDLEEESERGIEGEHDPEEPPGDHKKSAENLKGEDRSDKAFSQKKKMLFLEILKRVKMKKLNLWED